MKHIRIIMLCLTLLLAFALSGCTTDESVDLQLGNVIAEGSCGEQLTWQLDEKGLLLISGQGNMQYKTEGENVVRFSHEWDEYRDKIHTVCLSDGVTNIDGNAFSNCPALTSVVIPGSVENIDACAFSLCTALKSVSLGKGVKSIGGFAFYECGALSSLTLPDSVTDIDEYAFYNCAALKSVEFPNSVTSIGQGAFSNCTALERVELSVGVSSIGKNAFSGCPVLSEIHVAEGNPTYMDQDGVLIDKVEKTLLLSPVASSNSSCTIPDGITGIEAYAFCSSTALTRVEIPASVTSIGEHALTNCPALSAIHVAEGNPSYVDRDGVLFDKEGKTLLHYPAAKSESSYSIPAGVTRIDPAAFLGCASLRSVTIPDGVEVIDEYAFNRCTALTRMEFPDSVWEIAAHAFENCTALESATFHIKTRIEEDGFRNCPNLKIVCDANSYAETYAKENNIPYERQ